MSRAPYWQAVESSIPADLLTRAGAGIDCSNIHYLTSIPSSVLYMTSDASALRVHPA